MGGSHSSQLKLGDILFQSDATDQLVRSIDLVEREETVYNLEVERTLLRRWHRGARQTAGVRVRSSRLRGSTRGHAASGIQHADAQRQSPELTNAPQKNGWVLRPR